MADTNDIKRLRVPLKRLRAEYRYDKTEIRWVVIDPKVNPILARTMKQTGATRWHKFRVA